MADKSYGEDERQRSFMLPLRIDSSEWNKKIVSVPLRKMLVAKISDSNFLFYQDLLNLLVSWLTCGLFVYQQNYIKAFQGYAWFVTY